MCKRLIRSASTFPQGTIEIPVRVALRCRTLADVAITVASGVGIAVLPAALLNADGFAGLLRPVLTEFPRRESTLYLIYPGRKHVPFKARAFIDLVLELGASTQEQQRPLRTLNRGRSTPERQLAAMAC